MNPQYQAAKTEMEMHPTSPWTEAYQDASASTSFEQAQQDDDAQQPTHDALCDIYNRGYSA